MLDIRKDSSFYGIVFPQRIILLKLLYIKRNIGGEEIRDKLKLKDGFLWSHIRAFEKDGLMNIEKLVVGRKVYTRYTITEKGIKVYEDLRKITQEFLS